MNLHSLFMAGAALLAALLVYLLAFSPGNDGRDAAGQAGPSHANAPLDAATTPADDATSRPPRAEWKPPAARGPGTAAQARPLPPIGTPLVLILDELRDRAREGDAGAACRLAFELERCRKLPSTRGFAQRTRSYAQERAFPDDVRERQGRTADFWEAMATRDEAACEDVDPGESTGGWRYALQAARSGHVPSMIRFASGRMLFDGSPPGRNLDGWIALRDLGPSFLQAGIDRGHAQAFEQARFAYMRGEILGIAFPKDPVMSVALSLALARAGTAAEQARSNGNARFVERTEGLAPAQMARAGALADSLAVKLLGRHPAGSVDFTRGTFARDDGSHCEGDG